MAENSAARWRARQAALYVVGHVRPLHLQADLGRNRRAVPTHVGSAGAQDDTERAVRAGLELIATSICPKIFTAGRLMWTRITALTLNRLAQREVSAIVDRVIGCRTWRVLTRHSVTLRVPDALFTTRSHRWKELRKDGARPKSTEPQVKSCCSPRAECGESGSVFQSRA
jgi:hypothetical protein